MRFLKLEKLTKNTPIRYIALFIFVFFFIRALLLLDPDFGWHFKNGESILSSGFPRVDPFSYTMPSYPVISHEWLADIVIYFIYKLGGMFPLALISTAIAILSLIVSINHKKLPNKFFVILLLLGASSVFSYSGVRVQVISWLFLALLLRVLLSSKLYKKYLMLLPPFFLLWGNLHGSFAVGLEAFLIVIVATLLKTRKIPTVLIVIFLLCAVATLVNPYGLGTWKEVWSSISDSELRYRVDEWRTALISVKLGFMFLIALSLGLLYKYRKNFSFQELGLFFFFLLQAVISSRHVPLWTIVTLPLVSKALVWFHADVQKIPKALPRLNIASRYIFIFVFSIFLFETGRYILQANQISEANFYPSRAINQLHKMKQNGNVFSEYGWGGYLIWKYPEKRVFIDGRMPSWRRSNAPEGELDHAMDDYLKIRKGEEDFERYAKEFNIQLVLWPKEKQVNKTLVKTLEDKLLHTLGKDLPGKSFLEQLRENGWREVYADEVAVIYQKD